jgi:large subunit ribosomal protein L5
MTDTATQAGKIQPRLKTKYRTEISKSLTEEHGYTNVHQVPGLVKIVVNMGVGEAARDGKIIDGAIADLTKITGQKPQVTKARKSIAQFKLREGQPIGAHVTLRGDRMWEFLDRLLSLALPRIRDFRGLSDAQFDGNGNYTFGLTEQSVFHEIDQDKIDFEGRACSSFIHPMNVTKFMPIDTYGL